MIMQGEDYSTRRWLILNRHLEKHFAGTILAARTMSPYSRKLIRFLIRNTIVRYQPADCAVA